MLDKYEKSGYKKVSGNGFFKTLFNLGVGGEFRTYYKLWQMGEKYILTNVYLPKEDNSTSESDIIVINEYGIFVFESKNYSGFIYGGENSKTCTQSFGKFKKFKFLNPILQNKGHIKSIDEYLDNKYTGKFYSFIVFSERCSLKKIKLSGKNVFVIKRNKLESEYKKLLKRETKKLSPSEVREIYAVLKTKSNVGEDIKKKHIENIQKKLNA